MKPHQAEYKTDIGRLAAAIAARDKCLIIFVIGAVALSTAFLGTLIVSPSGFRL